MPLSILVTACATTSRLGILERVAKEWSQTIRASQVLPVYPLMEDLKPGDVYWDTTPIEQLSRVWKERGYLPLPQLIVRLNPVGYERFYSGAFGTATTGPVSFPEAWIFPAFGSDRLPISIGSSAPSTTAWSHAPRAAFPSYTFTVDQEHGLSFALPVRGVAVGLGVLGSQKAAGTIAIHDASTIGLDIARLWPDIAEWLKRQDFQFDATVSSENAVGYYRVVSRVFLAQSVDIQLRAQNIFASGVNAGLSVPSNPPVEFSQSPGDYTKKIKDFNDSLDKTLVTTGGSATLGSLRLTNYAHYSVGLTERFPRPLVVGFLGFDVPVTASRHFGAPVSTLDRVGNPNAGPLAGIKWEIQSADEEMADALDALEAPTKDPVSHDSTWSRIEQAEPTFKGLGADISKVARNYTSFRLAIQKSLNQGNAATRDTRQQGITRLLKVLYLQPQRP